MDISEMPLNITTSLTTVICYYKIHKKINRTMRTSPVTVIEMEQRKQNYLEFAYAAQFCFIAIPHTISWMFFRIFPIIFGVNPTAWYFILAVSNVLNSTGNAFFFLTGNAEPSVFSSIFCTFLLTVLYLVPEMISESYLYSGSRESSVSIIIGAIFVFLWNMKNITQILIAFNRYFVLCYNSTFFTKRNICLLYIPSVILLAAKSYVSQYWLPCCSFTLDQQFYSYSFIHQNNTFNYMNLSELSFDILTTLIFFIFYFKIQKPIEDIILTMPVTLPQMWKKYYDQFEIEFSTRFLVMAFPHMFTWIIFRLVFLIFGENATGWYFPLTVLHVLNCTVNAHFICVNSREMLSHIKNNGLLCFAGSKPESNQNENENVETIEEIPMEVVE
ncbi:unnamed protein product [Caenorhabditis angaria]|uniref:Uncharacterized protein n=1 Tax=Caenorhabditis angaria TaxID=860376 RepID=A0A9P1IUV0_9PELO|nr:unnamed protein product [Caenorhabditis angaria]